MKNIIITAQNSFLGNTIVDALKNKYLFDKVSLRSSSWDETSWNPYDVVCHVAGLAHVSYRTMDASEYFRINRDLALSVAQKAKREGVKQFLFFSTMLIYGESTHHKKPITLNSPPQPTTPYAQSKYEAEKALEALSDDRFKVVILRLPMVYGPNGKGNYQRLAQLALKFPVFPLVKNQRSMLFSGDLVHLVDGLIEQESSGMFMPQNAAVVQTSHLVQTIRQVHGKKTLLIPGLGFLIRLGLPLSVNLRKLFGSFYYDQTLSECSIDYQKTPFTQSIALSERG